MLESGLGQHLIDEYYSYDIEATKSTKDEPDFMAIAEWANLREWLRIFPTGILSVVSDTFDLFRVITEILPRLKEQIMARDGKLVIRPDSGDPVDITCGSKYQIYDTLQDAKDEFIDELADSQVHGEREYSISSYRLVKVGDTFYNLTEDTEWNRYDKQYYFAENVKISARITDLTPTNKGVIELLWDIFGGTVSKEGYRVLDSHIGAIYGDSITLKRQVQIYERLANKNFAATNIVLGVGSYTYQYNTRDTFGIAVKGSWFMADGVEYDIYKDPATDDGTKKSLKGMCQVFNNRPDALPYELKYDGKDQLEVNVQCTHEQEEGGLLQTIYEDGKFYNQVTLTEIRDRIRLLSQI
jgi:nicotinamide phosphoribosyltransferase